MKKTLILLGFCSFVSSFSLFAEEETVIGQSPVISPDITWEPCKSTWDDLKAQEQAMNEKQSGSNATTGKTSNASDEESSFAR